MDKRFLTVVRGLPFAARFYWRVLLNKIIGASINISGRCPIGCVCYWRVQRAKVYDISVDDIAGINRAGKSVEMPDEVLIALLHHLRKQGYLLAKLVGGEPYVRKDLLPRLAGIMKWTWIATSGTMQLIRLRRTTHFVSVDGADAETHDTVRKSSGLFDKIVNNLRKAREEKIPHVHIHMVLNKLNYHQPQQMVERFCFQEDLVDSIAFSLHTPSKDGEDAHLRLSPDEWQEAIVLLRQVQKHYPKRVSNSPAMIDQLELRHVRRQCPATCPTARFVSAIAEDGKPIEQCIFSPSGTCSECGCVITAMLKKLTSSFDWRTARIAARVLPLWD